MPNRRFLKAILLLFSAIWVFPAHAEERRIVFVEVERVFRESTLIQEIREKIQQEFKSREENVLKLIEDIRDRRSQLNKEGLTLSADEKDNLRQEIDRQELILNREDKALREDRNLSFSEYRERLEPRILRLISEIAKEDNYEVVLDSVVVLYGTTTANITKKVIESLDKNVTIDQLEK